MFQTFQVTGTITAIEPLKEFSPKYKEKVFVVEYSSSADFKHSAALKLSNTKLGMLDTFKVGDDVIVHFNPSSREAKGNWFTSLNVWKIERQR